MSGRFSRCLERVSSSTVNLVNRSRQLVQRAGARAAASAHSFRSRLRGRRSEVQRDDGVVLATYTAPVDVFPPVPCVPVRRHRASLGSVTPAVTTRPPVACVPVQQAIAIEEEEEGGVEVEDVEEEDDEEGEAAGNVNELSAEGKEYKEALGPFMEDAYGGEEASGEHEMQGRKVKLMQQMHKLAVLQRQHQGDYPDDVIGDPSYFPSNLMDALQHKVDYYQKEILMIQQTTPCARTGRQRSPVRHPVEPSGTRISGHSQSRPGLFSQTSPRPGYSSQTSPRPGSSRHSHQGRRSSDAAGCRSLLDDIAPTKPGRTPISYVRTRTPLRAQPPVSPPPAFRDSSPVHPPKRRRFQTPFKAQSPVSPPKGRGRGPTPFRAQKPVAPPSDFMDDVDLSEDDSDDEEINRVYAEMFAADDDDIDSDQSFEEALRTHSGFGRDAIAAELVHHPGIGFLDEDYAAKVGDERAEDCASRRGKTKVRRKLF